MKDKEMIEEMAKVMAENWFNETILSTAERLFNAGYRKLPEDSVVLSRKEYEKLKYAWITDSDAYKKGSKATAEKIIKDIASVMTDNRECGANWVILYESDIQELAKQFGVEIKE